MKANEPKRKIFADAVDLIGGGEPEVSGINCVEMLDVDAIKPFRHHPFHLYEGERLNDMVESIKEHGILTPVIVRKMHYGYEMLAGHNRQNAAKLAGLKEIPAIVKDNLPDQIFFPGFRSDEDWQAWELLSRKRGAFVYCNRILMYHRIHDGSETSAILGDSARGNEDFQMFCKFWPKPIARLLTRAYSSSEKSNELENK